MNLTHIVPSLEERHGGHGYATNGNLGARDPNWFGGDLFGVTNLFTGAGVAVPQNQSQAVEYLGHILHYVEGMIMEVRARQAKGGANAR